MTIMAHSLKVALWNANGLSQHNAQVQAHINNLKTDILLISKTHFTDRSHIKVPGYKVYCTNHPSRNAHAGMAVIIRNQIKHYELPPYKEEYIQATSIIIEDWIGPLTITAAYKPPRHNVSKEMFKHFFQTPGHRFIAGGDYNAKNTYWGARITHPKGVQLMGALNELHLDHYTTAETTYWPTHENRRPDLIDFFISKGIARERFYVESCLDLTLDHSAVHSIIS
jgi:hypothetical protein